MAKCTLTKRNKEAIKMSQSSFPIKGWMGVHAPWLIAAPILLSFIKGAASQCDPMNRPLTLRVVNEYTNILSTDYLNLPSRNINCQWKITANEGDRIALTVINIDLTSYPCTNQIIQIFDGETEYNRSLGIFCGRQRGQTLFSSARFMLIKFLSSGSLATGRFNLNYTRQPADSACRTGTRPTRLTGSTSYFTDLRFPSSGTYYSNNALCDWLVSVPNGYVVQLHVNSINMDASSGCMRDRMDIYDGRTDSYSLARICRNYSQTVNSSGSNMLIRFTSDTLVTRTVFSVSYKAVLTSTTIDSACMTGTRPTRLTGSTSYFTDLHFPKSNINYSNNAICDWLISVPNGYVVQLRVNSVNMETSSDCTWDRMEIYDGSTIFDPLLARICSNYFLIVNSTASDMLVHFTSDSSFTGTGFSVSYKAVLKSSVTTIDSACVNLTRPTRLTGSTNYFMDLRFPRTGNYYYNNALCDWLISVPYGYVVQLRVNSVGMETDNVCSRDRMDIYDGSTVSSPSLARICRNNFQIVNSTDSDMLIRFTSDNSVTGSGFSVSYKAVLKSSVTTMDSACRSGTRPTSLTGSIYSFTDLRFPSSGINYSNNAYCDWLISVPNGYVVQLRVNSVNMEAVSGCTRDRMDIYDGSTVYSLSLARICRYYYYQTVYSTGTNMLIHFTSDSSITGTGFSISYKAVLKSSVTTTTAYTYHGGYSDYSSSSILAISIGVTVAFLASVVLGVIIYQCTRKSSRSPARHSNMAVATRDNVSSRYQRTQTAPQERHDVYTLPTAFPTTAAPFFTNCGYSTFGDQPPTTFPPRNLLAGGNQNPPSNFIDIGPPEYSYAPPSYSEVVNGCYTHDS